MRFALVALCLTLAACESDEARLERVQIEEAQTFTDSVLRREIQDSIIASTPHVDVGSREYRDAEVAKIPRPCDGPRPYRHWSNGEVNISMVNGMGEDTPQQSALILEATCRYEGR